MGELASITALADGKLPIGIAVLLGLVVFTATFYLKSKSVHAESFTSINKAQADNITQLIAQNAELSKDLFAVRVEMQKMHEQLEALVTENMHLKRNVKGLEDLMRRYVGKCESCPHASTVMVEMRDLGVALDDASQLASRF